MCTVFGVIDTAECSECRVQKGGVGIFRREVREAAKGIDEIAWLLGNIEGNPHDGF